MDKQAKHFTLLLVALVYLQRRQLPFESLETLVNHLLRSNPGDMAASMLGIYPSLVGEKELSPKVTILNCFNHSYTRHWSNTSCKALRGGSQCLLEQIWSLIWGGDTVVLLMFLQVLSAV